MHFFRYFKIANLFNQNEIFNKSIHLFLDSENVELKNVEYKQNALI